MVCRERSIVHGTHPLPFVGYGTLGSGLVLGLGPGVPLLRLEVGLSSEFGSGLGLGLGLDYSMKYRV